MAAWSLYFPDEAATRRWGRKLGQVVVPGTCLALVGPLGAGKTVLASAILEGLGAGEFAGSPTFLLCHEYRGGRIPACHIDVYRLAGDDPASALEEMRQLGAEEWFSGEGVTIVEWADRIAPLLPGSTIWMRLAAAPDGGGRRLSIEAPQELQAAWLAEVLP